MQVNHEASPRRKAKRKFEEEQSNALIQKLMAASFVEIDNWVDNNITDLQSAKALFKRILAIMSYLLNKGDES